MAERLTRLEEIEKRLGEATPGPYEATLHQDAPEEFWCIHQVGGGALDWGEADCQFLAHSWADFRDLLAVAKAAAALPWIKSGMLIEVDGMPGLSGPSKDPRFRRLQEALDALEKPADG